VHGFADASSRAYAVVVYLRVIHSESNFQVSLICAKTKFAVKTISTPRLELNAVVLLSRLLIWTQQALSLSSVPTYGWTDSTITLAGYSNTHRSGPHMLRIVSLRSKHRCRALRGIMFRQRKTLPIAPPVGYRHQCYCRMTCGETALLA